MILSPKEKFQQSQIRTGQWAQIIANPIFDEAVDSALLQMQKEMPSYPDVSFGAWQRMSGAMDLIRILKTIHEKQTETIEKKFEKLNYQAGV